MSPPTPEDPPSDQIAEDRALAEAARTAGEAVQRLADLARLTGRKLDGYPLEDLDHLARNCQGWALGYAFGAGATDLIEQWTGRPWRQT